MGGWKEARRKEPSPAGAHPQPTPPPPPPRDSAKKSGRGQTRGESYHQIG